MGFRYEAQGELWLWNGKGSWFFITLPQSLTAGIKTLRGPNGHANFGSVKVTAQIGETRWRTSLFPSNKHDAFLLPVKAAVRAKEGLTAGDQVSLSVEIEI